MASKSMSKTESYKKAFKAIFALVILALLVVSVKHMRLKSQWMDYAGTTQKSMFEWGSKSAQDQGTILAVTSMTMVNGRPFYRGGREFETYIANVSKTLGRDIVVIDKTKVILADTVSTNIGKKFSEDSDNEILKTIADGMGRSFVEKSTDYPQGITQTVVPMKDAAGTIVGAVIISQDKIGK